MLSSAKTYEYRYLRHDSRVYTIGKNVGGKFQHRMLFTEPFYSKEQKSLRNSVIGFISPELAAGRLDGGHEPLPDCELVEMHMNDLKQMATILRMPLVIELNKETRDDEELISIYYFMPESTLIKMKMF